MVDLTSRRTSAVLVPLVLVVTVVVVVLVLGTAGDGSDDPGGAGADPTPGSTPASTPASPPASPPASTLAPAGPGTQTSPEEFCAAFRAFADANAYYASVPGDEAAAAAFEAAGAELVGLGQPLGLSEGGLTTLRQLVDDSLAQTGDPVETPSGAPADPAAFDAYLAATCPA